MDNTNIVLLPGLDGTGTLFKPFITTAPANYDPRVIVYPPVPSSYPELAEFVRRRLPTREKFIIIAESFSGPVGVLLAATEGLSALVLCISFIVSPIAKAWRYLPWLDIFKMGPPKFALRKYLLGPNAPKQLADQVRRNMQHCPPEVLAQRIKEIINVDVTAALQETPIPILDIRSREDKLISNRSATAIAAVKPDIVQKIISGPHLLLQTQPQPAWRAINAFVKEYCLT